MAIQLNEEVKELLQDKDTLKVLATTGENGIPHVVIKQTLHLGEDGNLVYLELIESSRTNKNLVRAIWFDRKVALALKGKDGESWQITGKPVKAHVTGPIFQKHYVSVRERLGDVDLATVWVIEPEEVTDQSFSARRKEEEALHPTFAHLDRLAKRA